MANLQLSKIQLAYGDPEESYNCIANLNSIKTEELVHYYHHYEN